MDHGDWERPSALGGVPMTILEVTDSFTADVPAAVNRIYRPRLALQLHRFSERQLRDCALLAEEAAAMLDSVTRGIEKFSEVFGEEFENVSSLHGQLVKIPKETACTIHQHAHYLGSPRPEGAHLVYYCPGVDGGKIPVSLVSIAATDLDHLNGILDEALGGSEAFVVTRLVAFPWAPRNTASATLGAATRWLRNNAERGRLIITYLDPNLGFAGSVYRAVNGVLLGVERKKRYVYLNGAYVSDRELIRQFGTADTSRLLPLGASISTSVIPLIPLELWGWAADQADDIINKIPPICVSPPVDLVGAPS